MAAPRLDPIARLTLAACTSIYECPTNLEEVAGFRILFSSAEDCAERVPSIWWRDHPVWGWIARLDRSVAPLVAIGRVRIDEAALAACVTDTAQCVRQSSRAVSACTKIFVGTTPEGGRCTVAEACRSGLYCSQATSGSCPGVCVPRIPVGSPCTYAREEECEEGAFCTSATGALGSICTALDRPPLTVQTVGRDQVCDSDASTKRRCEAGLYCQASPSGAHICMPAIAANAPCNERYRDFCVPGHLCLGPDGRTTCQPVPLRGLGNECTGMGAVVQPCNPWAGLTCLANDASASTGTCGAGGKNGQTVLRLFDDAKTCLEGFTPTGLNSTCEPLLDAGTECHEHMQCASGVCGDGTCHDVSCD